MAPQLYQCPACGGPVAYGATACPRCGWRPAPPLSYPPPQPKGPSLGGSVTQGFGWACGCLLIIPAIIVILVLLASLGSSH